ncbi:unnamed protein product, partial [Meganyctiphanes norvegica]
VYDKITKLNSLGIVSDIKSKNSYTVIINNVPKHVSGDNMSHTVIIDDSEIIDDVSVTSNDPVIDTDSISMFSDDDIPETPTIQATPQQQYVRRHEPAPVSPRRLRSGRIYANRK